MPDFSPCKCEHAYKGLGILDGTKMGKGWLRVTTHPLCPEHALCQGYTAKVRAKEWNGEMLYCNVHGRKNCK